MLMSFTTLLTVSAATKWLFESGRLPPNLDIFHCVVNIPEDFVIVQEPHEEMTVLNASQAIYYQTSEMNGRVNPALDTEDETINKITNKDTKSDTQIGTKTFEEIRAKPTALIGSIGPGQVIVTKL
jgi:high affinity choline transporter 7